jgi:hypothetical protein
VRRRRRGTKGEERRRRGEGKIERISAFPFTVIWPAELIPQTLPAESTRVALDPFETIKY